MNKILVSFFFVVSLIFPSLLNSSFDQDNCLTIILVRHAEKVIEDSTDPPLTEEGKIRAAELAYILKYVPLDAIFSTPYIRTRETVLPSSEEKGIKLEYYNAGREKELLMRIFNRYKGKKGCVLITGHSNTIHLFLNFLVGEDRYRPIEDDTYDNFFVVTASFPGKAAVLHLRYGKHSSHVHSCLRPPPPSRHPNCVRTGRKPGQGPSSKISIFRKNRELHIPTG